MFRCYSYTIIRDRIKLCLLSMWRVCERGVYRVLVGKPEGRNHWGDLGVDGWIIIGWITRRWDVGMWTGFDWPWIQKYSVRHYYNTLRY